jgi:DNA-binding transcriptional ArsR family regulator
VRRGPQGHTPGELAEKLAIPAPTLSFHLKELQHAGLVSARRQGRFLYYSASFDLMRDLVAFLTDQCCSQADGLAAVDCKPLASSHKRKSA